MRKMRRPSLAASFGRGVIEGVEEGVGAAVAGALSSCVVADFFRGGNR